MGYALLLSFARMEANLVRGYITSAEVKYIQMITKLDRIMAL